MAASKDYAARSIAALEATNATLRAEVSSQAAHIAMLEEKLLTMSVELASSRAREDEQNLMFRRQQLSSSQVTIMSEDSERSLGSGMGVSGLIGNIFNNLDRSDRSEGRRSSTMSDTDYSQELSSRRISMVGSLFRSRKSELTDDTVVGGSRPGVFWGVTSWARQENCPNFFHDGQNWWSPVGVRNNPLLQLILCYYLLSRYETRYVGA